MLRGPSLFRFRRKPGYTNPDAWAMAQPAIAIALPNGLWTAYQHAGTTGRPHTTTSIWPPGNRGITVDPG